MVSAIDNVQHLTLRAAIQAVNVKLPTSESGLVSVRQETGKE
jgi:hypothetical protein